jgi:hypothetical protein
VRDVVYDARGTRANGTLFLEWPSFTTAGGRAVAGSKKTIQISNGVLDLLLEPTEGATPTGLTYTARFSLVGGTGVTVENWAVPDSASPVNLASIRVSVGGTPAQRFADGEVPAGPPNGVNATFTLANVPSPAASLMLARNGIVQKAGLDYLLTGRTITFVAGAIPQDGDVLLAWYRY